MVVKTPHVAVGDDLGGLKLVDDLGGGEWRIVAERLSYVLQHKEGVKKPVWKNEGYYPTLRGCLTGYAHMEPRMSKHKFPLAITKMVMEIERVLAKIDEACTIRL